MASNENANAPDPSMDPADGSDITTTNPGNETWPSYVYVAGFLVVYANQRDGKYRLDQNAIRAALPPRNVIPININHDRRCEVGRVLALIDDAKGLFCVGVVYSALESTLMRYAPAELFDGTDRSVANDRVMRFLYVLSNILPSLSLSSVSSDSEQASETSFFDHVALCEIGKREGTVAIYGMSVDEAVSAFKGLSSDTRVEAQRAVDAFVRERAPGNGDIHDVTIDDSRAIDALMGKFVSSAFLMNRGAVLRARREIAEVREPKYLQASEMVGLADMKGCGDGPATTELDACSSEGRVQKADVDKELANTVEQSRDMSVVPAAASEQALPVSIESAMRANTTEDFVYVPYTRYTQLLNASAGAEKSAQMLTAPHGQQASLSQRSPSAAFLAASPSAGGLSRVSAPEHSYPAPPASSYPYSSPAVGYFPASFLPPSLPPQPQAYLGTRDLLTDRLAPRVPMENAYTSQVPYGYSAPPPFPPQWSTPTVQTQPVYVMPPQAAPGYFPTVSVPTPIQSLTPAQAAPASATSHLEAKLDALLDVVEHDRHGPAHGAGRKRHRVASGDGVEAAGGAGGNYERQILSGRESRRGPPTSRGRGEIPAEEEDDSERRGNVYFPGECSSPMRKHTRGGDAASNERSYQRGVPDLLSQLLNIQRDIAEIKQDRRVSTGVKDSEGDAAPRAGVVDAANASVDPSERARAGTAAPATVDASGLVTLHNAQKTFDKKRELAAFVQMMAH